MDQRMEVSFGRVSRPCPVCLTFLLTLTREQYAGQRHEQTLLPMLLNDTGVAQLIKKADLNSGCLVKCQCDLIQIILRKEKKNLFNDLFHNVK